MASPPFVVVVLVKVVRVAVVVVGVIINIVIEVERVGGHCCIDSLCHCH